MPHEHTQGEPLSILLVEDNPAHAVLVKRTLGKHPVVNRLVHVSDGEEALDYLFRREAYADPKKSPTPQLILLDLRLPKIQGLEVLKEVKSAEELKEIPVVILTTSDMDMDVAKAYEYRANSYLVKPLDFEPFRQMMNDLGLYWTVWNRRPRAIQTVEADAAPAPSTAPTAST